MKYDFSKFSTKVKDVEGWLSKELGNIRTSRASPTILDGVEVQAYGSRMPIRQTASISSEDARTIRVVPWDTALLKEIEKSIIAADLGLSVSADDQGVRVAFPALTEERRKELVRLVGEKVEAARVSLRKLRDEVMRDIDAKEKAKEMSKDEQFRFKGELQKQTDAVSARFGEMAERKETEIMS
jgi:ribosome recycling factor